MTITALNVTAVVRGFSADVACFIVSRTRATPCTDYAKTAMPCVV